jgi:hypothetical protein
MSPLAILLFWVVLFGVIWFVRSRAEKNRWQFWVWLLYGLRIGPRTDVAQMKKAELLSSALRFLTWGLIFLSILLGGTMLLQYFYDGRNPHGFFLAVIMFLALFAGMGFIGGLFMLVRWLFRYASGAPEDAISLDSVSFDTTRYRQGGEIRGQGEWFELTGSDRAWLTPEGDVVAMWYRPNPPDLPSGAGSIAELREHLRSRSCDEKTSMVEFRLMSLSEVTAIQSIFKLQLEPHGVDYQGLLTIPFAKFTFDIAIRCDEKGTTGVREAVLLHKALQAGTIRIDAQGKVVGDWNPDDPGFDELFPQHALSRLRREMDRVVDSLRIEEATRKKERFRFPEEAAD